MGEAWDMVIVGGGPAGATAGALLAEKGFRVAVCEGKAFPRQKVCGEFMGTRLRPVLKRLGVLGRFEERAGPPVKRVLACTSSGTRLVGELPADAEGYFPRAMDRGEFDDMLLARARECGAAIYQPCHVDRVSGTADSGFAVHTTAGNLAARTVILAHGLAQSGGLDGKSGEVCRDFVSFKAHFSGFDLHEDTIAIGGGEGIYAGMVHSSQERYSLAFVTRRERLARFGNTGDRQLAGFAAENPGFRQVLRHARRSSPWLTSGPLSPGVREIYRDGRFFVGNAAGEVHALVGEGITLALRTAGILADVIQEHGLDDLENAGRDYERRWRGEFAWRHGAANVFANLMMRPALSGMAGSVMEAYPGLLEVCIRQSGK